MRQGTTLNEIAKITGYSVSTVSKALSDSAEISKETKNKIKKVSKLLGYRPNKTAISLRSGKNYCIAVIIPSIEDSFYARVYHGIQSEIVNTNYSIMTCITNECLNKEKYLINKIFNQVDAFIIAASEETILMGDINHLEAIHKSTKPIILIDRAVEGIKCCQILSDSTDTIKTITTKVLTDGYKSIALVSSTSNVNNELKKIGFDKVSEKDINIKSKKNSLNSSSKNIKKKLLKLVDSNDVDCIITTEEGTTFTVLKVLKQINKRIPEDIALVGYMSEHIAESLDVSVSTINQHRKTMGIKAMQLALEHLKNPQLKTNQNIIIESTLIKRQSYQK